MRADEATAMARVFADAPMEDVYEIVAIAMNVLDERDEDLVTQGESNSSSLIGNEFKIFFDAVAEKWRVEPL